VLVWGMSSRKFDNLLGMPSMLAAVGGVCLLITSTINYDDALPTFAFWLFVIIGMLPILGHVILNYGIVIAFQGRYGIQLQKLQERHRAILYHSDATTSVTEQRTKL